MLNNRLLQIIVLLLIVIIGFVPWLDQGEAKRIVEQRFSAEYRAK